MFIFISFVRIWIWKNAIIDIYCYFLPKKQKYHASTNKICAVHGEGAVAERTLWKSYARLEGRDFTLKIKNKQVGSHKWLSHNFD